MRLPDDFPVMASGLDRQTDRPITHLHRHDCLEIGLCHSGSGVFVIEDKVFPFREGDVSVINDREMHLAQSSEGTSSDWTWISLDPQRLLGPSVPSASTLDAAPLCGPEFRNVLPGAKHQDIVTMVRELISELRGKKPGYRAAVRGLVWALMARLHRLPGTTAADSPPSPRTDIERIAPALQYVATHFTERIRIEDLARVCHLSLTHFRRLFTKAVGKSPMRYVAQLRIQMASALLENTNRTMLDISCEVGYDTPSSFNRQFKLHMGMSPREWRRR